MPSLFRVCSAKIRSIFTSASTASDQGKYLSPKEQRRRLIKDHNFRLLKVEHSGFRQIKSLTVVTPALVPKIADDVDVCGWSCISHLWGDQAAWIDWDDSGVVDGQTRKVIVAKLNPSKCGMIMELLKQWAGYWWIDVFCTESDTPLVIMGDIYKLCYECVVLTDSPYEPRDSIEASIIRHRIWRRENHEDAANGYLARIAKAQHEGSGSAGWLQVLKDLLHWSFSHLDDSISRFDGVEDFNALSRKEEQFLRALHVLAKFLDCQWMNRVWTLQEYALSKFISVHYAGWPRDELCLRSCITFLRILIKAHAIRATSTDAMQAIQEQSRREQTPRQVLMYYQRTDPLLARIYSDYRKVLEVAIVVGYNSCWRSKEDLNESLAQRIMLNSFATSKRIALYPQDYVYGVLGIFDIDVPRLKDLKEIWRIFSEKLNEKFPDIQVPSDVDLSQATKMEDVYGGFGFTTENDISKEVVDYIETGAGHNPPIC